MALATSAPADEVKDREARGLFEQGKAAFEGGQFADAYELFKRSYLTSQQPQLLFNMASCLGELNRPREAAEELRTYLRLMPEDPDRPAIEQRIGALDEKQRLLDLEPARRQPPAPPSLPLVAATPPETPPPVTHPRRRLAIGLGVAGAAIAILVVGLTVGLTVGSPADYRSSTLGTFPATK
jgi:hypothetical protein